MILYEVSIKDVLVDDILNTPVLDVRIANSDGGFKIWVGPYEGTSIADALCTSIPPRPNTHDIASKLISELGAKLEKVIITDIISNTYYADMIIKQNGTTKIVDSRPSDAIAIAIRLNVPIFVTSIVLEKISSSDEEIEKIRKILNDGSSKDELKPEDFM